MEGGVREVKNNTGSENMVTKGSVFFSPSPGVKVLSDGNLFMTSLYKMPTLCRQSLGILKAIFILPSISPSAHLFITLSSSSPFKNLDYNL